jgi:hypothetical protein
MHALSCQIVAKLVWLWFAWDSKVGSLHVHTRTTESLYLCYIFLNWFSSLWIKLFYFLRYFKHGKWACSEIAIASWIISSLLLSCLKYSRELCWLFQYSASFISPHFYIYLTKSSPLLQCTHYWNFKLEISFQASLCTVCAEWMRSRWHCPFKYSSCRRRCGSDFQRCLDIWLVIITLFSIYPFQVCRSFFRPPQIISHCVYGAVILHDFINLLCFHWSYLI